MRKKTKKNAGFPMGIPTLYKGITYRSRLESRVAQLLDNMGLVTEYEPRSLLLRSGICFTPDFFCSAENMWVESRG